MPAHLGNSAVATGLERCVFIPIPKKGNAKECSNYHTIALISHASEVMLKILQARRQQYVNRELPDVQAGFRKGRGTSDQIANILWIIEKAREFEKSISFCIIDYVKAFDCVDHNKLPDHLSAFWEICMQVKKQQLELGMEQWTDSKLEKEYIKAVYCHPAYLPLCRLELLCQVWLFATPRTAAHQASLSINNSQSLLKLISIESVMPSIVN